MTLPANIRVNTSVPFPSLVKGSGPITVTKQNGVWTVGFGNAPSINMGQQGTPGNPLINFFSGGSNVQYDSRLIATGGNTLPGGGTLDLNGTLLVAPQAASLQSALTTAQSAHGTTGNTQLFNNLINITSDDANCGNSLSASFSIGQYIQHLFGGPNATGGREGLFVNLIMTAATNAINANRFYVASSGQAQANATDGGAIGGGNEKGLLYGSNFLGVLGNAAATGFAEVSAGLDQVAMVAGTSSKSKSIRTLSYDALDAAQGTTFDAALMITADAGAAAGGKNAILIGNMRGAQPLATNAAILSTTGAATVGTGIDISGYTVSGNAFRSNNFNVDGSGNLSCSQLTCAAVVSTIPTTLTGTSGSTNSTSQIINPSNTFTLTLPSAAGSSGRWLYIKLIAAFAVNSASSNVVPLAGGAAGTAILTNTPGKWAWLQSDGANWIIMAGN